MTRGDIAERRSYARQVVAERGARKALRLVVRSLAWTLAVGIAIAVVLVCTALAALRAGDGEWALRVPAGARFGGGFDARFEVALGMPSLIRVATHPLGARLLDGRSIATPHGTVRIAAGAAPGSLVVRCAPCRVDAAAIASRPLDFAVLEATLARGDFDTWSGTVSATPRRGNRVVATWHGRLARAGAEIEVALADTPVADLVALFGSAVPEAAHSRIEGRAGGTLRIALPSLRHAIVPRLEGLEVAGLGTEALLAAKPPACARAPRHARATAKAPFGPWLPKAVVAAEDQRFHEHPGYDLAEMAAAWSDEASTVASLAAPGGLQGPLRGPGGAVGSAAARRGASTLTQQLARLAVTGDERTAARKVRELLVAAELERTLGKPRILALYLAIAPWGDGQCGAEAAALHHFGRPAASLDAAEAVWLASLLRNPDALLDASARGDGPDARLAAIARAMRPLPRADREAVAEAAMRFHAPPTVDLRRADSRSAPP